MNNQQNVVNLSVKDFQIIKSANLSFLPGLNCIIGQSNNGKSALMRAAKTCIYNIPGTNNIRLGCNSFAIGMQMNGHTVILQKGLNNSIYRVDNDVYGKIGRTQLDEVANALRVKQLNINGSNEEINFWDQMEKPFLLDRSETDLFRFIVDSGKDNNVTLALKTITQDRQQITKDITITEGKIQAIEDTIKKQEEDLKDIDLKLNACNRVIELGPKIKRVKEITSLKDKTLQDGQLLSINLKQKLLLDNILNNIDSHLETINNSVKKSALLSTLSSRVNTNSSILSALENKYAKIKQIKVPNFDEIINRYKLLTNLITSLTGTLNEQKRLYDIKFPEINEDIKEKVSKYTIVGDLIERINSKKKQIEELSNKKEELEVSLKEVNKEIEKVGVCPLCGQPIHNN